MEERRIVRIGESMKTYAEVDRQVIPIIGKCLDGIVKAAESIDQKNVSVVTGLFPCPSGNTLCFDPETGSPGCGHYASASESPFMTLSVWI